MRTRTRGSRRRRRPCSAACTPPPRRRSDSRSLTCRKLTRSVLLLTNQTAIVGQRLLTKFRLRKFFSVIVRLIFQSSRRAHVLPKTDVHLELAKCRSEFDITLVDRINALLNRQTLSPQTANSRGYKSMDPSMVRGDRSGAGDVSPQNAYAFNEIASSSLVANSLLIAMANLWGHFLCSFFSLDKRCSRRPWMTRQQIWKANWTSKSLLPSLLSLLGMMCGSQKCTKG